MKKVDSSLLISSLNALRDPLIVLDSERECLFANSAFLSLWEGGTWPGGQQPHTKDFWPGLCEEDLSKSDLQCEWRRPNMKRWAVKLSLTALPDGYTLVRMLSGGTRHDPLSDLHSQRLETLGMLASGVAHDFNNVLTGIMGHVAYMKSILPATGPHQESLKSIEEGARKASSLSQQILNFSRLDSTEDTSKIDLGDLVSRTIGLLRGAISPEVSLNYDRPTTPLHIYGVEGRIAQVLVNLAVNARDAVRSGGKVDFTLGSCRDTAKLHAVFGLTELPCAAYVVVGVCDNGHGMSKETMERMFEPYFSTKKGKGTGLGLSTVAAIVRQMGGAIDVHSTIDVGTQIYVYFPMVDGEPQSLGAGEAPNAGAGGRGAPLNQGQKSGPLERGTERVLVVDDEYAVRNVVSLSLQHLGYDVDVAASGIEALERYQQSGKPYDLVILDMLMPEMSGDKVFFRLREIDPRARVLLISGFASEEAVRSVLRNGGKGFLQKPFTIDELAKRARACFLED